MRLKHIWQHAAHRLLRQSPWKHIKHLHDQLGKDTSSRHVMQEREVTLGKTGITPFATVMRYSCLEGRVWRVSEGCISAPTVPLTEGRPLRPVSLLWLRAQKRTWVDGWDLGFLSCSPTSSCLLLALLLYLFFLFPLQAKVACVAPFRTPRCSFRITHRDLCACTNLVKH